MRFDACEFLIRWQSPHQTCGAQSGIRQARGQHLQQQVDALSTRVSHQLASLLRQRMDRSRPHHSHLQKRMQRLMVVPWDIPLQNPSSGPEIRLHARWGTEHRTEQQAKAAKQRLLNVPWASRP